MQIKNYTSEDIILTPVDIGAWRTYQSYTNKDQIAQQRENLYYTGLHNGLGDICFIFTTEMAELNQKIEEMSRLVRIENTTTVIEDEIFYTTKIEGAKTTRKRTSEIHNGSKINKNNEYSERMVKNGFRATKLLNLCNGKISKTILLKTWKILTNKVCDNDDIKGDEYYPYRTGDVMVGSYVGPSYQSVDSLMNQWITFYNSDNMNEYPFIKASLLHYAFETIHPFCDGNGRMGRLLINNFLIKNGIDSAKAVSFSMQIDARRGHYDVAFVDSENIYNDCTPFIQYILEIMYSAYELALEKQQNQEIEYDNKIL